MSKDAARDEFFINKKKFQFLRLMAYFKSYLFLLILGIAMAILVNVAVLAKPYIFKNIIDDYLVPKNYNLWGIRWMGILYLLAVLVGSVVGYIQTYVLNYIGQNIMFRIRNQLFEHVQRMSLTFFDKNSTGRILTRVTNDIEALNEIFSGVLINILRDILMIIGILVMMFVMDVRLAFISISCVPVIALTTVFYRRAARKNFIKMKGMIAKINGFLAENVSGMKMVQIFHREKEKMEELKELDKQFFASSLREVVLNSLSKPIIEIINSLTIALLVWYCAGKIMAHAVDIGVLFAFMSYIKQIFQPISEIADKYTSIQSAFISSERIFEILDTVDVQEDLESGLPVDHLKGDIEFRNVWFAYNEENWVLRNVSFTIQAGESVAFVGATGSGKSTIISLIARFYDIQRGEILLDGRNIKEYNLKHLRKSIAVVLQDVFLFSGDIKSNIRLNNESITDEEIIKASALVNADKFIEMMPGKYEEEIKERGCTLSAGQKQLISFARAIAFNPSIMVLDEATANIDTETELVIQHAISAISEKRTFIVIAHRLSTIRNSDKIVVIHKGRVKEIGNHEELLQRQGMYYQLHNTQLSARDVS